MRRTGLRLGLAFRGFPFLVLSVEPERHRIKSQVALSRCRSSRAIGVRLSGFEGEGSKQKYTAFEIGVSCGGVG